VMAAYLVGTRGTRVQALLLALAVAVSHTTGVLALAALTLAGSAVLAPERAYPYLSTLSGALMLALGAWMVGTRARHAQAHRHRDPHEHDGTSTSLGWRSLAALGLAGGVVPSASALVLLLGAISLHRIELGVVLVVAFGVGMAAVLVGAGQVLVGARGVAERRAAGHRRLGAALRLAPNLSAIAVLLLGAGMTAQSLAALL
jgi:nickel/cobalt exporter